jgi:cytochrome P450
MIAIKMSLVVRRGLQSAVQYLLLEAATQIHSRRKSLKGCRPRIQQIVDGIIDRLEPCGRMDLIADFAFLLPVTVISDMLGIPEEDREVFFTGSRFGGRLLDLAPLSKTEIEEQNSYNLAMAEYFQRSFELRRRKPGNDLPNWPA